MYPDFGGNTGPTGAHREYDPGRAKSHIQLYPPVSFSIHEFVICVLKKVEKSQAFPFPARGPAAQNRAESPASRGVTILVITRRGSSTFGAWKDRRPQSRDADA